MNIIYTVCFIKKRYLLNNINKTYSEYSVFLAISAEPITSIVHLTLLGNWPMQSS